MSKSRGRGCAVVAAALLSCCVTAACAYEGRLLDGATGKPVADAWVIGHWETGGGHGGGCVLAITKTNQKGEFTLVNREGLLGWILPIRSHPAVEFYKRGYQKRMPEPANDVDPYVLDVETRPVDERIRHLRKLMSFTDCGSEYIQARKVLLAPLYLEFVAESREIASSRDERLLAVGVQAFLDRIVLGIEEATRRSTAASEAIRRQ